MSFDTKQSNTNIDLNTDTLEPTLTDINLNTDMLETKLDTLDTSINANHISMLSALSNRTSTGNVASHAADSGNPVKVGGKYNATPPTLDDGDRGDLQLDVNGNTKVTQATALAGEDLTNDVIKVEQRFSGSMVSADALIKSGAGFLHSLTFAQIDAAPTAGTIIVYDNTAESGTILYSETFDTTVFRGYSVILDIAFSTGLYIGFTTTADVGVTPSFR